VASVLHGSARTTPRIRAELKAAQAPARLLASQYGLNVKTVLKWRNRAETTDARMGPESKSTILTPAEEAIIVEFRRRTLLPLDDVLGCLKDTIPNLSRSALHRVPKAWRQWQSSRRTICTIRLPALRWTLDSM